MARYRFKISRIEVRDGEIDVTADSFAEAAAIAAKLEDMKVPRGAMMRTTFNQDNAPSIHFEISAGRELSS